MGKFYLSVRAAVRVRRTPAASKKTHRPRAERVRVTGFLSVSPFAVCTMSAPSAPHRFSVLSALRPGAGALARLVLASGLALVLWLTVWWAS